MKTWAQIEQDQKFTSAPIAVKKEVRQAHLQELESRPDFKALSPEEQAEVRAHILGGYPTAIQTAAHLIAASLSGEVEKALLEDDTESMVADLFSAATAAERALDVPLKDRQREKFPDLAHFHVDRPLRALLCFIEEGLPEFRPYKRWQERKKLPLAGQVQDALSSGKDSLDMNPVGHEPKVVMPERPAVRTPEDLMTAARAALPGVDDRHVRSLLSADHGPSGVLAMEQVLRTVPEVALKARLSPGKWPAADAQVLQSVGQALSGAGNDLGAEAPAPAVQAAVHAATERAYEALARSFYGPAPIGVQGPANPLPLRPESLSEYILGSVAAGPDAKNLAVRFPAVYLVVMGMADVPLAASGLYGEVMARVRQFFGAPDDASIPPTMFAQAISGGEVSLIAVDALNRKLWEAAATEQGVRPDQFQALMADLETVVQDPAHVAILGAASALAEGGFQRARAQAMKQVAQEVQKIQMPPQPAPKSAPEPNQKSLPGPTPLRIRFQQRPLDRKDLTAQGLWGDFERYGISQDGGQPLNQALDDLSADGTLPQGSTPPDLLDALDQEDQGAMNGTR